MLERKYYCDICRDSEEPKDLFGVKFHGTSREFSISSPYDTDGTHICKKCLVHLVKIVRLHCPFCGTQDNSHSADCAMVK